MIEYEIEGDGKPLLVIHGSFGGIEQARLLGKPFKDEGFKLILVSRPGYPGTPIEKGRDFEEQAELIKKVLDENNIDKAHVLGYSAGGTVALRFAKMYGNAVDKLVLASSVVKYESPSNLVDRVFERNIAYRRPFIDILEAGMKSYLHLRPKKAFKLSSGSLPQNQKEIEYFKELSKTVFPISEKKKGIKNDLIQVRKNIADLDEIKSPALVIDHKEYPEVEETTNYLSKELPNCQKTVFNKGGHITWLQTDKSMKKEILGFIQS